MAEGVQPPWDRLSKESPHKRRRRGSLHGFCCCRQPRCSLESVYFLQRRLRRGPRAQKKSISPRWGEKHKGRGGREKDTKLNDKGAVQNSPATLCSSIVHSHLPARVTFVPRCTVLIGKIWKINVVAALLYRKASSSWSNECESYGTGHLLQKGLLTMFTKQPVKHLVNLPTKTQEVQTHIQIIESYVSLSPSQTTRKQL